MRPTPKAINDNRRAPIPVGPRSFRERFLVWAKENSYAEDIAQSVIEDREAVSEKVVNYIGVVANSLLRGSSITAHATYMAVTSGLLKALFALIRAMDPHEAWFMLEEIHHETDRTVKHYDEKNSEKV